MMILLALFLVPLAALGLVLGMDRVEDSLLKEPAKHRSDGRDRTAPVAVRPAQQPALVTADAADALTARAAA